MTDARVERWKDAEVLHEWDSGVWNFAVARLNGGLLFSEFVPLCGGHPIETHLVCGDTPAVLAEEVLRLTAALGIAERALEDLGACDDEACTEPNCLHALVAVRGALRGGENR